MPTQPTHSGLELVSEVSDLAAGAGILAFALAPFALPALALTALLAVPLLLAAVVGASLAAPGIVAVRSLRRASLGSRAADRPARRAGTSRIVGGRSATTHTASGVG